MRLAQRISVGSTEESGGRLALIGRIDRISERRMRLLGQIAHTWTNAHNRALVFVRLISLPPDRAHLN
jgi:hypothetical protein